MYSGDYELRIELQDWQNEIRYAKYSFFSIDFKDNFRLRVLGYTGTAGIVYIFGIYVISVAENSVKMKKESHRA